MLKEKSKENESIQTVSKFDRNLLGEERNVPVIIKSSDGTNN